MLVSGDWLRVQIDYQPFWEKPPLFLWMQALSMKLFGMNEFAARLPNAICGIVTLLIIYSFGKKTFSRPFAWAWVLAYLGSILPHLYFRSGIIDPWFNLLIFSGLWFLFLSSNSIKSKHSTADNDIQYSSFRGLKNAWQSTTLAGLLIGLAILTKGPVAYLIPCLVLGVYWMTVRFQWFISIPQFLWFSFVAALVPAAWFGVEIWHHGTWFLEEFISYQIRLAQTQDAGHGGFFGYHFVVLLIGCFPASFIALRSFNKTEQLTDNQRIIKHWLLVLFGVVLILFSIVQSKIVHYSSLCYFPLTFLAALTITQEKQFPKYLQKTILLAGIFFSSLVLLLPILGQNIELLKPLFEKDKFALANLDAEVTWTYWHLIPGLWLLGLMIYLWWQKKANKAIQKWFATLFIGVAIFINLTLFFFINNIEGYSQRAAIDFYKNLEDKNVYVRTVGFKSYAHLFYTKKQDINHEQYTDYQWLTKGKIDRDVYFVTKIHKRKNLDKEPNLELIRERNGFVFYVRKIK